ncbi:MAG: ECF transporter S component [Deltaproteobacteria bacterium]|jgi:energy-coupling factor transport system substrate-specific component|nr:ECF transporter S component [Deltaproteobacteria bacterium]
MANLFANFKPWKLREAILVGIVSVVFGVIYLAAVYLGIFLSTLVSPLGLAPLANEPIYGIWFMASTFIAYFVRKPGAAVVTEVLAALLEVLMGNMYGPLVLVSGTVQGLGAEVVFMATSYKNHGLGVMAVAGMGSGLASFVIDFFISGFGLLSIGFLAVMLPIRLLSSAFFCGLVSLRLATGLERTGLTKAYRVGRA